MADYKISKRYAGSFLENAIENNILENVSKDLLFVGGVLKDNPKLNSALVNPIIKSSMKISILDEIFKGSISNDTLKFLKFVVERNREELLAGIIKVFLELRNEHLGIAEVEVRSAVEMTEEQKKTISERFHDILKKKIMLKNEIDPGIIGGFIAKVGDTVYDASIKHQLELLKKQFLAGSVSLN